MKTGLKKLTLVQVFLWIALILALAGSLRHVAVTFASIDGNSTWGWVQAIAVDIGLFALALAIMQRRRIKRPAIWLIVGVVLFSLISIYANLAYGLTFTLNLTPDWIQASKPWVLAATLPILVIYLAEIVGSDMAHAVKQVEKDLKAETKKSKAEEEEDVSTPLQTVDGPITRQRQIVGILTNEPDTGASGLSKQLDVSRTTIYSDLNTLVDNGAIEKNGKGYIVKEVDGGI